MKNLFRRILSWLGLVPARIEQPHRGLRAEQAQPGTRVVGLDGTEGTITCTYPRGEQIFVRVVFTAPRASWVSLVSAEQLELA